MSIKVFTYSKQAVKLLYNMSIFTFVGVNNVEKLIFKVHNRGTKITTYVSFMFYGSSIFAGLQVFLSC